MTKITGTQEKAEVKKTADAQGEPETLMEIQPRNIEGKETLRDTHSRDIEFEGIVNARDLGGLQTMDGKTVRRGCLIRSANLFKATPSDVESLQKNWHLRLIIDLRTPMAAGMKPDAEVPGARYLAFPLFEDAMIGVTHESDRDYPRRKTVMPDMRDLYRMMVLHPKCRERFGKMLMLILQNDYDEGSVLWHCSEGKDRCGLTAAFLLTMLKVDFSSIAEDYLLTNRINRDKAEDYYRQCLANGAEEKVAMSVRNAFLAREDYLAAAFDSILKEYEDMDHYFTQGLQIPEKMIEKFCEEMKI